MILRLILEAVSITTLLLGLFFFGVFVGNGNINNLLSPQNKIINNSGDINDVELIFSDNMSEEDIEYTKSLVNEVDYRYSKLVKKILFIKHNSEMNPKDTEECIAAYGGIGCGGINYDGEITIKFAGEKTRYVLCHELLHDYIPSKSNKAIKINGEWIYEDPGHAVIEHLSRKYVCYG